MSDHDVALNSMGEEATDEYVTVTIAGQLFGLPIRDVEEVFVPGEYTQAPLSRPEVAGVLNLRGRTVTAIDMRTFLGLEAFARDQRPMAVGINHKGEAYCLLVDRVGEVYRLAADTFEANPANLDPRWVRISAGIHRLQDQLMVVVDVNAIIASGEQNAAA